MDERAELIDYYAILNLPHDAKVQGIENAYARLSAEFAVNADADVEGEEAFRRLNEAYNVLSRADLRRQYDAVFLADERKMEERAQRAFERKRGFAQWAVIGTVGVIVLVEAVVLLVIARDDIYRVF
ncbi:MAG: DnaJ domain-containing protein [Dehalococcoidia bacterium]